MDVTQELRFAARVLAKDKGSTAVAALALALGVGANVAIFSFARLMLWTPLPYPHSEQLVHIPQTNALKGFNQASVSLLDARDWAQASSIASVAVYRSRPVALTGQGDPQHVPAMQVSPEFFPTLGVLPILGRAFSPAESPENESRVAILSYEVWQGMYRGDRGVLGRDVHLDGRNYSIVGVMPEGFRYLFRRTDFWTPLSLGEGGRERGSRGLNTVARLKPGVTVAHATAEVRAISERMEKVDPKAGLGWRGVVRPLADRVMPRAARTAGGTMLGAVGFVLLIACANVASLLLARGTQRRREFAVRASLGATRARLMRLQLAESLLLSVAGGAMGVLSAIWTTPLLRRIAPPDMDLLQTASLDWNALGFGLALSLATVVVFGAIPAWLLTRGDLARSLRDASRGSTGGRHTLLKSLVAAEMALALVLVAASTLMVRSLIRQANLDPGFDKKDLMTATVLLPAARYPQDAQTADFYSRALENLRRDGRVSTAALVQTMPLGGDDSYSQVFLEGEEDAKQDKIAGYMVVSPGYFEALRIPLLAGRDFTEADNADSQKVAIVNQTFAKRYWPKEASPIGRRVRMGGEKAPWVTVVGLARDVHHTQVTDPPRPEVYRPHKQVAARTMILVARGRGGAQNAAEAVRSAVWQVDREQPLFRLESVEALLFNRNSGGRATTQVLGFLAVVALVLAAIGTYGVMAYTSAQRVREIGIRLALGATGPEVFRTMLRGGVTLALIGLVIGLPATYAVAPLLRSIGSGLEAVDSRDGASYAGVAIVLFTSALLACIVPAWRAMRVAPASVLRDE
jgi:putative ABC transport system permease protein